MRKDRVGIIGYGKFGGLVVKLLDQWPNLVDLKIYSIDRTVDNKAFFGIDEACQVETLIISVPINQFQSVVEQIKDRLRPQTLVVDVSSVQIHPRAVLLKLLDRRINILTTHPNFGPESYRLNQDSTKGFNWIVDRTRCNDQNYNKFSQWLTKLGVNQVEMSAQTHDKRIGVPHFASLFQGILLNRLNLENDKRFTAVSTKKMLEVAESVGSDLGISRDMVNYNPFIATFLEEMTVAQQGLIAELQD